MAQQNETSMQAAVAAMGQIEQSSDQITAIISVIGDIAFQTNLLALNAGVEGARVGDSGKGFAVVASEVRALPQRSSEAAGQIKTLIDGSTDRVKEGALLVSKTGEDLNAVVSQIHKISGLVGEIATAAQTQAQGIEEINVGVSNLDDVTQQNTAMVEETTAAAHTLRGDTNSLNGLVQRFQIGGRDRPEQRWAIRVFRIPLLQPRAFNLKHSPGCKNSSSLPPVRRGRGFRRLHRTCP